MNRELRQIASSLHAFARSQGWAKGSYRIFCSRNADWGVYHVIFIARDFDTISGNPWFAIMHFLENYRFDNPDFLESINLTLSTSDQVAAGGLHSVGQEYEEINDLIVNDPAA